MKEEVLHKPVLAERLIDLLNLSRFAHSKLRGKLIDATFGLGGYERLMTELNLDILGIEIDPKTIKEAEKVVSGFCRSRLSFRLVQGNFRDIKDIAKKENFTEVDAIIFDLGVSSFQLDSPSYGISFRYPESPLDMRLEREISEIKASDLLNTLSESQLTSLFAVVLNENLSKRIARLVTETRKKKSFEKVKDLLELVDKLGLKKGKLHPATKVFLALRMAVNSELENLKSALPDSFSLLKKGGRLSVISFHSGEDKIVKEFFESLRDRGLGNLLTKKPIAPFEDEILANPRSRSARLRVIEKI